MLTSSLRFIDRWVHYEGENLEDQQFFFIRKREILFSRILFLSIVIISIIIFKDVTFMKVPLAVLFDVVILMIILSALWMVRLGHHNFAKGYLLVLINAFTTFYSSSLPIDRGIFLYYFPLITVAFAIFDDDDKLIRIAFILLPVGLLILLVITDFNLFDNFKLPTSKNGKYNLIINAVLSSLMTIFFVEFMMKANRESERILRSMAEDLQRKKDDIEKANRELDRFVYSTSHDLRAPLSSIKGLISIARADIDTSQYKNYFAMIEDRTNKLDDFINEIIDYSRNARAEIIIEEANVHQIVTEVINNLKYVQNAGRIKFDIDDNAGIILTDKSRVKIALNNLISNAIKYQNLRAENSWVKVITTREDDRCIIQITDNGIGIRPALQPKIFEMFYRATEASSGSGLGLYIVKEIMERLKGSIEVKSVFGDGTTFFINIPLK